METKIIGGANLTQKIREITSDKSAFVVSDSNVALTYGSLWQGAKHYIIPAGEGSKTLDMFGKIAKAMLDSGCDRQTTVVAIGGGVAGDLAGFVAATYMRGVKWVNVPTTLLAQVDSSVGGKTAVDLGDYKNIIGAFHLPEKVLVSTHFLYTLPDREWLCGMGEIIKTAFLDRKVYEILDGSPEKLLERDEAVLEACVHECITYKRELTARDLYESGPRKALNVGHTIGHALEKTDKHRRSHGEYVLMGMEIESFILGDRMDCERRKEISAFVAETGVDYPDFNPEEVAAACMKDKKNGGGAISVMLPDYENTREVRLSFDEVLRGVTLWKLSR